VFRTYDKPNFPVFAGHVGEDDIARLLNQASAFKGAAFAKSTVKTYKSQTGSYLKFCMHYNVQPLPSSQETLCSYLAFLSRSLSPNSIKGYMNAVRLLHIEAGFPNPIAQNWEISMIQRGISRLMGKPPKQKMPITIQILTDLHRTLVDSPSDWAFWLACLVAFYGFLRKSTLLPQSDDIKAGKYIARSDVVQLPCSLSRCK
jgi:hypothetical protein